MKLPFDKPARFEVGDPVKLMWKQRSQNKYFCIKCGKGVPVYPSEDYPRRGSCCTDWSGSYKFFPKVFGEGKILEVFKITLGLTDEGQGYVDTEKLIDHDLLAKLDGFRSLEHMMSWFDDRYDLSQAKPFWVYRWKWL